MSELKFPIYARLGRIYFKWTAGNVFIKSHLPYSQYGWGISRNIYQQTGYGDWINRNPSHEIITPQQYDEHIAEILSHIQEEAGASPGKSFNLLRIFKRR